MTVIPSRYIVQESGQDSQQAIAVYRCQMTGIRIVHRRTMDPKYFFGIGFRSPAQDDTGLTHILEHTVFSGNQKFRDTNIVDAVGQCTMSSMINAITFPDKTVYFAESMFKEDIGRLAELLLPACLAPQVLLDRRVFEQEAYLMNGERMVPGVVYNEMLGVQNNPLRRIVRQGLRQLFRSSHLRYESGGLPEAIAKADWDALRIYFLRHYRPHNMIIYLSGNCDATPIFEAIERLEFNPFPYEETPIDPPARMHVTRGVETLHVPGINHTEQSLACFLDWGAWSVDNLMQAKYLKFLMQGGSSISLGRWMQREGLAQNVSLNLLQDLNRIVIFGVFGQVLDTAPTLRRRILQEYLPKVHSEMDGMFSHRSRSHVSRIMRMTGLDLAKAAMNSLHYGQSVVEAHQKLGLSRLNTDMGYQSFLFSIKERLQSIQTAWYKLEGSREAQTDESKPIVRNVKAREERLLHYGPSGFIRSRPQPVAILRKEDLQRYTFQPPQVQRIESPFEALLFHEERLGENETSWIHWDISDHDAKNLPYIGLLLQAFRNFEIDSRSGTLANFAASEQIELSLDTKTIARSGNAGFRQMLILKVKQPASHYSQGLLLLLSYLENGSLPASKIELLIQQLFRRLRHEFDKSPTESLIMRAYSRHRGRQVLQDRVKGVGFLCWLGELMLLNSEQRIASVKAGIRTAQRIFASRPAVVSLRGDRSSLEALQRLRFPASVKVIEQQSISIGEGFVGALSERQHSREAIIGGQSVAYAVQSFDLSEVVQDNIGLFRALNTILIQPQVWKHIRDKGRAYGADSFLANPGYLTLYSTCDPNYKRTISFYRGIRALHPPTRLDQQWIDRICVSGIKSAFVFSNEEESFEKLQLQYISRGSLDFPRNMMEEYESITQAKLQECWDSLRGALTDPVLVVYGNAENLGSEHEIFEHHLTLKQDETTDGRKKA